jgi:hypothetical protein
VRLPPPAITLTMTSELGFWRKYRVSGRAPMRKALLIVVLTVLFQAAEAAQGPRHGPCRVVSTRGATFYLKEKSEVAYNYRSCELDRGEMISEGGSRYNDKGEHVIGGKNDRCGWGEMREKNFYTGEPNLSCESTDNDKPKQPPDKPKDPPAKPEEKCLKIKVGGVWFEKDGEDCANGPTPTCCTLRQGERVTRVGSDSDTNDELKVKVACNGQEVAEGKIQKFTHSVTKKMPKRPIKILNAEPVACNSFR